MMKSERVTEVNIPVINPVKVKSERAVGLMLATANIR